MTELIVPAVAYRPVKEASRRPNAWNCHLLKSRVDGDIRTVCGLILAEVEIVPIREVPRGRLCKQCLGAMKERED
jgi:hypothetical protein